MIDQLIFDSSEFQGNLERLRRSKKPVILYGAGIIGYYTVSFFKKQGISVECFCDDDVDKGKVGYLGFPVISFSDLCERYPEAVIVPTLANCEKVVDKISSSSNRFETVYFGTVDICDDNPTDERFVKRHMDEFDSVYELLADDRSRSVFLGVLNYKLTRDISHVTRIKSRHAMYFEPDIVTFGDDDVFLDVGAFTGDSIEELIRFAGKDGCEKPYRKIYALEPDPENFKRLKERVRANHWRDVECLNYGAWDTAGELSFASGLDCGSTICVTDDDDATNISTIQTETIDRIVGEDKVSFIKMDIEGAEFNALKGAESTIARERPSLAISVYHKSEDMFVIPLYLKRLLPHHRFYLRHYTDTAADTVLYCVSDKK